MRRAIAALLSVFLVAAFLSAGCSRRSKKHKKESLRITTISLPDATEAVAYSYTLQATGGNPSNYNWSISGQPSWLSIDASTGELSGTPPAGSAGTYRFTIEVTDGQQTASKQFDLQVRSGGSGTTLKADFEASPTYGTASLTVAFTDKSTGSPTSWDWDFDNDGTADSTQQNPTHTYNDPGWYTVKLTISDGTNNDTCVKEKYILVASSIYYVDGVNGDDGNGGTGWSDAWKTIGKALSVAGDYDLVVVADATYNETDLNFNGKKICLKGVDHNTSGAQPVIDRQQAGEAFIFDSGETEDSVIDNFTIKNSNVLAGGAIYCNSSSPTIVNCTFSDNYATWYGGAICCANGSKPTLTNCTFSGNSSDEIGGAIYCQESSSPTITNCTFSGNSAVWYGGAIYCQDSSSPSITDCTFSDNSAKYNGGAVYCTRSSLTMTNCLFSGNSASGSGGAIYFRGSSSSSITDCTFSGNNADWDGGAIYCDGSSPTLTGCRFSDISANAAGGAIACLSCSPPITDCTFSSNNAKDYGGAIDCNASSPTVTNCIFSGNSAGSGGAIECYNSSSPTLNNCILWNNAAGSGGNEIYISDSGSSCTLNYCCVDNTGYGGQTGNITENNCIYDDPQFVDPANGDYHLQDTSPCIDAGNNGSVPSGVTTDLDGNQRIVDGDNNGTATVDIGAYEYQP
ncbi:MAG: hypothetical protein DRP63_02330 [Planctomycetota bacterium]|nr:MAG: hypothetical protein DRP63_02330 [Planctomycetota bacterium]